jgi:hypothetical protein
MQVEHDYWEIGTLSRDAAELGDLLAAGSVEDAEASLLRMAHAADSSGFGSLSMAALRAARTLAVYGISGALGADLLALGDELKALMSFV